MTRLIKLLESVGGFSYFFFFNFKRLCVRLSEHVCSRVKKMKLCRDSICLRSDAGA